MGHAALTLGVAQLSDDFVDTDQTRAERAAASLAERFGIGRTAAPRDLAAAVGEVSTALLNATPVGMAKYPGLPMPAELLRHDL